MRLLWGRGNWKRLSPVEDDGGCWGLRRSPLFLSLTGGGLQWLPAKQNNHSKQNADPKAQTSISFSSDLFSWCVLRVPLLLLLLLLQRGSWARPWWGAVVGRRLLVLLCYHGGKSCWGRSVGEGLCCREEGLVGNGTGAAQLASSPSLSFSAGGDDLGNLRRNSTQTTNTTTHKSNSFVPLPQIYLLILTVKAVDGKGEGEELRDGQRVWFQLRWGLCHGWRQRGDDGEGWYGVSTDGRGERDFESGGESEDGAVWRRSERAAAVVAGTVDGEEERKLWEAM